jgi:nucleoside-triphosphatase THEP1
MQPLRPAAKQTGWLVIAVANKKRRIFAKKRRENFRLGR